MTQTASEPMITVDEWLGMAEQARQRVERRGMAGGPSYNDPESAPVVWYDQIFGSEITPSGTVQCPESLRVGSTNNGLDLILVASHANAGNVAIAAGATITVTLLEGESADGAFTEVGPTICVKAPAAGISVAPDHLAARFALGNFHKPWLKVKLAFAGGISGGKLDAALSLMPR